MKGLFILSPCRVVLLVQIILLFRPNSRANRILHTAWTGWLFGPYLANFIPHLDGIDQFEIVLYYIEHIALVPCGYLILASRYGFLKPNFKNSQAAYSTSILWLCFVLVPLSRSNMVNLNFAICHSPADPFFDYVGHFYFICCIIFVNLLSYVCRWVSWIQIKIVYTILKPFGIR